MLINFLTGHKKEILTLLNWLEEEMIKNQFRNSEETKY